MDLLSKNDDELLLIGGPEEGIQIGDVCQSDNIISQVTEIQFANLPGILEHVLRQSLIPRSHRTEDILPEVQQMFGTIADKRLIKTKIRGHLEKVGKSDSYKRGLKDFNVSREKTKPEIISQEKMFKLLDLKFSGDVIAEIPQTNPINFDFLPEKFGINLITGQKGSGKSYFSKKLLLKLIKSKVVTIVFDVNGEYQNLYKDENDKQNDYASSILILDPRIASPSERKQPFRVPLSEMTAEQFCKLFGITEDQASFGVIGRFWNNNRGATFGLNELEQFATGQPNERVRDAILARVENARAMNIFGPIDIKEIIKSLSGGGALIINLARVSNYVRSIIVSIVLKSITNITENGELKSASLFLEEAQLYVETKGQYLDLLTRMRHVGVYPTFITNDPQTLPDEVLALADNIISFRFNSDPIIAHLSRSGMLDVDTFKTLRNLEDGQCLAIGKFTNGFPFFLKIKEQKGVKMGGETKPLV